MRSGTVKSVVGLVLISVLVMAAAWPSRAARDMMAPQQVQSDYELLVLEVAQCIYCQLFRRDVLPTYQSTLYAKSVPMRFIDIDHGSLTAFKLSGPIETVPTVVLLHGDREVGRVAGHIGPETFLHAVNRLLSQAP